MPENVPENVKGFAYSPATVWEIESGSCEEEAFFGVDRDGTLRFWSFTSDEKQSQGQLTDVSDVHPLALGFEAQMPAGLARQVYWPDEQDGQPNCTRARAGTTLLSSTIIVSLQSEVPSEVAEVLQQK